MAWKITPKMLKDEGACESSYRVFCRLWPRGMVVTKKNLRKAVQLGLGCSDCSWAARQLIGDEASEYYWALQDKSDCFACRNCEPTVNAFYATVKKFRSV